MSRLPILKASEIIRALEMLGFVFSRQKGSHAFYKHPQTGRSTIVPIHGGDDIDRSFLRDILREAGMSVDEFLEVLKK